MSYLTEQGLGTFIKGNVSSSLIHDKSVPGSSRPRLRPNYRIEHLKLIIEFDGYGHYINPKQILNDQYKNIEYHKLGYTVLRIPYFVQLSTPVIKHLFNIDVKSTYNYPHGFIDNKATLPSYFCELGVINFINFINYLNNFSYIAPDIIESLKEKVKIHGDINVVLPPSLHYLID